MSRLIVDFIMNAPGFSYVQREWIGRMPCENGSSFLSSHADLIRRVKNKLKSGEMVIPGDHWPVFLYAGYDYHPDDPWKGLFKSTLLVSV
jgi:hypothetical protein